MICVLDQDSNCPKDCPWNRIGPDGRIVYRRVAEKVVEDQIVDVVKSNGHKPPDLEELTAIHVEFLMPEGCVRT